MPYQPLTGTRVLDLSRLLPGPFATQLLADLGAEVIKVELPGAGDYARSLPPELGLNGMFGMVNRGKKSLGLDFRTPRGREILLSLCQSADILLESFRPGAVKRWGIAYDDLCAAAPGLIYCSLSGYGQDGPYRDRAGHDLNYAAIGGALSPQNPSLPSLPLADLSGSMLAAVSILAALAGRQRTGQGAYLDVSLLDGMIALSAPLIGGSYFHALQHGGDPTPVTAGKPFYAIYRAADGQYLAFAPMESHFWERFCQAAGRMDLLPRQFDPDLGAELTRLFLQKPRAEWLSLFSGADACIEPVNSIEQVLHDPQVRARGHVRLENDQPTGTHSPFIFARAEDDPAPRLGQHTREILSPLLPGAEIEQLAQQGVITL
jgi:crotonobetainyl-CoA:carnitine CoA-transferase CaiB-like acyl-CoA transferase